MATYSNRVRRWLEKYNAKNHQTFFFINSFLDKIIEEARLQKCQIDDNLELLQREDLKEDGDASERRQMRHQSGLI